MKALVGLLFKFVFSLFEFIDLVFPLLTGLTKLELLLAILLCIFFG